MHPVMLQISLRICAVWSESSQCILDSQGCKVSSCRQWIIRLHGCAGWSESLLGVLVRRYVFLYNKTCVRQPPLKLTLVVDVERWLSYKGTCHVILLAKLHDMYLYKTDNFFHIYHYLKSVSKVALTQVLLYSSSFVNTYHAMGRFSRWLTDDIFLIFPRK